MIKNKKKILQLFNHKVEIDEDNNVLITQKDEEFYIKKAKAIYYQQKNKNKIKII